jgi:hypothetical protein
MAVRMRLVISIQPPDIVFGAQNASFCRLEAFKGATKE